jgi:hypothetical protein
MNSVLTILCIVFLSYLTHYIIKGYNQIKEHGIHCKTIYIPEDFDLSVALDTVAGIPRIKLERRALELGIKRNVINSKNDMDLKIYIVQKSIEEKHIMTMEIEENIKKIEAGRVSLREKSVGDDPKINYDQVPQLNPNVTIDALRDDLDDLDDLDD